MKLAAKILIVEDELMVATAASDILEDAGYDVVGMVADFERAFLLAEQERPDIAIVDMKLANPINGTTVARELVKRYGMRIIFATGYAATVKEQDGEIGFAILAKPYSRDELLTTVAACASDLAGMASRPS